MRPKELALVFTQRLTSGLPNCMLGMIPDRGIDRSIDYGDIKTHSVQSTPHRRDPLFGLNICGSRLFIFKI